MNKERLGSMLPSLSFGNVCAPMTPRFFFGMYAPMAFGFPPPWNLGEEEAEKDIRGRRYVLVSRSKRPRMLLFSVS